MSLQEKLLVELLNLRLLPIHDADEGANMIQQRLKDKKVLIVLDDLDRSKQLEKLAGAPLWFGKGSIIIITTRNVDYLVDNEIRPDDDNGLVIVKHENFYFYEMQVMQPDDALKLFSRHAFKSESPPLNFDNISREVVATAGGLPLAIEVIGPSFYLKGKNVWREKLKKLKKVVNKDVREKLMISYEDLDPYEKEIFLDIACLFINKEKIDATYYWEAQGLFPKIGINVLINKSLIRIVYGDKLWMHDLLRDLGRNIVHEENCKIPGKRSRLWLPEEAFDVVRKKKGTEEIIALKLGRVDESCSFTGEQFAGLTNLKFLELDGGNFTNGEFNGDFSELRWLSWDNCPKFQATNLNFESLVILKLSGDYITETWGGWHPIMEAKGLKVLMLSRCPCLMRTPSFDAFPSLRRLAFYDCHQLKEIDWSIGKLKNLYDLTISNEPINTFQGYSSEMPPRPRLLLDSIGGLKSLTVLKIHSAGLMELHPSIGDLVALKLVRLRQCPQLGNLPSSIGKLTSLLELDISYSGISELPDSIGELRQLKELHLWGTKITELPYTIGNLKRLKALYLSCTPLEKLPKAIGEVCNLEKLIASYCLAMDGEIPEEIGKLSSLRELNLKLTPIDRVPTTINQLSHLRELYLGGTRQLWPLPQLPTSLEVLEVQCPSLDLESISNLSNLTNFSHLVLDVRRLRLPNISQARTPSPKMEWLVRLTNLWELSLIFLDPMSLPNDLSSLSKLDKLDIGCLHPPNTLTQHPPGVTSFTLYEFKFPTKIDYLFLSSWRNMSGCVLTYCRLREIEVDALEELQSLYRLDIAHCKLVERLSGLSFLNNLGTLGLYDCPKLIEIQGLEEVTMLEALIIWKCSSLQRLHDLSSLQKLRYLRLEDCEWLSSVPDVANKESCYLSIDRCARLGGGFGGLYCEYTGGGDMGRN